jgi:hypothetical protein
MHVSCQSQALVSSDVRNHKCGLFLGIIGKGMPPAIQLPADYERGIPCTRLAHLGHNHDRFRGNAKNDDGRARLLTSIAVERTTGEVVHGQNDSPAYREVGGAYMKKPALTSCAIRLHSEAGGVLPRPI